DKFVVFHMKTITKVFWLFGRSGAGKTTLAQHLRTGLIDRHLPVVYLDGDEVRSSLCADLGFRPEARLENHRRIAEIARLLSNQGINVVVSTMAPEHQQRDLVAKILSDKLVWFYIHASLDVCIQRDPKGLYKRALAGTVKELINYPFEVPRPQERENYINTAAQGVEECYLEILAVVKSHLTDFEI
ncbi:MAG: adenylyl-sulfate kinase, partial [Verrucomicrobiota bacterium]